MPRRGYPPLQTTLRSEEPINRSGPALDLSDAADEEEDAALAVGRLFRRQEHLDPVDPGATGDEPDQDHVEHGPVRRRRP